MDPQFQPYDQHQRFLFPPSLNDMIGEKALVRVVNDVIDKVRPEIIESPFAGGGRPAFHPRMMLKVIIYAYCCKIYSSRQIAKAMGSDINFIWLSAWQLPDFRTVNRFRSEYFKDVIGEVFADVVHFLVVEGYVRSSDYFVDGTKLAADASKFSYVWKKNVERFKEKVKTRAREIMREIEEINVREDHEFGDLNLPEMGETSSLTSAQISEVAEEINKTLSAPCENKSLERQVKKLEKEGQKLKKYEGQEELLDGRNSYSKTDTDASFMRMKDGELRAAYNVQIGTQDGYITGCTIHQNANDASTLKAHLSQRTALNLPEIDRIVGDAGYGTEENYQTLEQLDKDAFLKYPDYVRDRKGAHPDFHWSKFKYNENENIFTCPAGKTLIFITTQDSETVSGFKFKTDSFKCESCEGCPFHAKCVKGGGNRSISLNRKLNEYRKAAFEKLTSPEGAALSKKRGNACETPFADIKHNQGVRRFRLRGLVKASVEMLLHSISTNLRKVFGSQFETA